MSLSRPAKFSLLKLPWLCIDCIIKSCDIFDIILFVLTSKRARQIVKHLKIPLNGIEVCLTNPKRIKLDSLSNEWCFRNESEKKSLLALQHQYLNSYSLVLQKNAIPLYTSKTDRSLMSYSNGPNLLT